MRGDLGKERIGKGGAENGYGKEKGVVGREGKEREGPIMGREAKKSNGRQSEGKVIRSEVYKIVSCLGLGGLWKGRYGKVGI